MRPFKPLEALLLVAVPMILLLLGVNNYLEYSRALSQLQRIDAQSLQQALVSGKGTAEFALNTSDVQGTQAIYLSGISGSVSIAVNGREVHRQQAKETAAPAFTYDPVFVSVAGNLTQFGLKPKIPIAIRVDQFNSTRALNGHLFIGPKAAVSTVLGWSEAMNKGFLYASLAIAILVTAYGLLIHLSTRYGMYLLISLASAFWFVHVNVNLNHLESGFSLANSTVLFLSWLSFLLFSIEAIGAAIKRLRETIEVNVALWITRVIYCAGVFWIIKHAHPIQDHAVYDGTAASLWISTGLSIPMTFVLLRATAQKPHWISFILLLICLVALVMFGTEAIALSLFTHGVGEIIYSRFASYPLLGVLFFLAFMSQRETAIALSLSNLTLQVKVRQAQAELQSIFERKYDQEKVLAVNAERRRVVRSIDSSFGAQLASTLNLSRDASNDPLSVSKALEDCLVEFRLAIDTLIEPYRDVSSIMMDFKNSVYPNLQACGLDLKWVSRLKPEQGKVSGVLNPEQTKQLVRILQESVTIFANSSRAKRLTMFSYMVDGHVVIRLQESLEDRASTFITPPIVKEDFGKLIDRAVAENWQMVVLPSQHQTRAGTSVRRKVRISIPRKTMEYHFLHALPSRALA